MQARGQPETKFFTAVASALSPIGRRCVTHTDVNGWYGSILSYLFEMRSGYGSGKVKSVGLLLVCVGMCSRV